jgi:hypothetical protein
MNDQSDWQKMTIEDLTGRDVEGWQKTDAGVEKRPNAEGGIGEDWEGRDVLEKATNEDWTERDEEHHLRTDVDIWVLSGVLIPEERRGVTTTFTSEQS